MGLGDIRWLSAVAIVVGAAIIITLERLFPYDKGQKFFREGWFYDFFLYTIAQSYALGMVISFIIEFIDTHTGLSRLRLVSDWPIWLQLLFFLVTHDFYIYWFHRLQHTHPLFWRIHEAHHSAQSVDWLSGSRSHALEILINQTVEFAPIVLLGAPPEVAVLKGTIDALWGMYIHSNIDVRSGWLQYIINGPEMHRWHHATDPEAHNKNFSTKLAIWDWLFGTAYFPPLQKPKGYGLSDPDFPLSRQDLPLPQRLWMDVVTYFRQQLHAFRRMPQRV
jgi:sterol desaturase/sphingolipid hydroxylase (fatty acid hydroxylase superfamily)